MTDRFNPACGCVENINPCNTVFKRVDELPPLGDATRNHGYVLPDNTVWVVNSDGTGFTQLNGGAGGSSYDDTAIQERLEALEEKTDNDTIYDDTSIKERLDALEEKTDNDTVYDDTSIKERLTALEEKEDNNTQYTAGTNIKISENNVISATDKFFGNVTMSTTKPTTSGVYLMANSPANDFLPTQNLAEQYIVMCLRYDSERIVYTAFNTNNGDTYSKVKNTRTGSGELDWKKLNQ